MRNLRLSAIVLATIIAGSVHGTPAQAQATRTWVSNTGSGSTCSVTAPCLTFAAAIAATAAGGEINCLTPGGFGSVTISKSITIDCEGTTGGIMVSSGDAIDINTAGVVVNLRGLDINGLGTGSYGINITAAATVDISNSKIYGFNASSAENGVFTGTGILIDSCCTNGAGTTVVVTDSRITSNGTGIVLDPYLGLANMTLRSVVANYNGVGVYIATGQVLGIGSATHAGATIDRSTLAFNSNCGLQANGGPAVAIIGDSTVTGNATGVCNINGGTLLSMKNNWIAGNSSDGTPLTAFSGPGGTPLQ